MSWKYRYPQIGEAIKWIGKSGQANWGADDLMSNIMLAFSFYENIIGKAHPAGEFELNKAHPISEGHLTFVNDQGNIALGVVVVPSKVFQGYEGWFYLSDPFERFAQEGPIEWFAEELHEIPAEVVKRVYSAIDEHKGYGDDGSDEPTFEPEPGPTVTAPVPVMTGGSKMWQHKFAEDDQPQQPGVEEIQTVFDIPEHNMGWLTKKVDQLNRRAAKLGVPPIEVVVLESYARDDPSDETGMQKIPMKKIEVKGEPPIIRTPDGQTWKFVSRIIHASEGGNVLMNVPGEELPTAFRTATPKCEHCNTNRRRNDTYVLKNPETGEYKQVGSSCIKDFLGHRSANEYAKWAEALAMFGSELGNLEDEDFMGGGGRGEITYGIESFMAMIRAAQEFLHQGRFLSRGWANKKNQEPGSLGNYVSTVDAALGLYHSRDKEDQEMFRKMMSSITDEQKQELAEALDWARNLKNAPDNQVDQLSDYLWNLSVAASLPVVTRRTAGIVGSLWPAYKKAILDPMQEQGSGPPSSSLGSKGQEVVARGELLDEEISGNRNTYRLRTEDGQLVQWLSDPIDAAKGDTINVFGEVFGYARPYGLLATTLGRARLISDEEYEQLKGQLAGQEAPEVIEYQDGQRQEITVTVKRKEPYESEYGSGTRFNFQDSAGTQFVWFSSGRYAPNLEIDERLTMDAMLKKSQWRDRSGNMHENWKITRPKILSRELGEGAEDKRLPAAELKQLQKEIRQVKKQIKDLDTQAGGITNGQELSGRMQDVETPIMFFTSYCRDELREMAGEGYRGIGTDYLIENWQNIDQIIDTLIQTKQARIEQMQQEIAGIGEIAPKPELAQFEAEGKSHYQARNEYYAAEVAWRNEWGDRSWKAENLKRHVNQWSQAIQQMQSMAGMTLVGEFKRKAQEAEPHIAAYHQNEPLRRELETKLRELEDRLWKHKDYVKQYGALKEMRMPLASSGWLSKIASICDELVD
jgi:hypothetical protein